MEADDRGVGGGHLSVETTASSTGGGGWHGEESECVLVTVHEFVCV